MSPILSLHRAPWFWAWVAAFAAFLATWSLTGGGGGAALAVATMAMGRTGGLDFISQTSQPGAVPPGEGRISTAMPPQTKDMPSVTTMAGSCRISISAPRAA